MYWSKIFLLQAIQFSQTVLIQTIQFSISMQFSSIQPIDRALSGATILGQSGPGSNGNEEVLRIPQSPSIIGTSPWFCVISRTLVAGVLTLWRGSVSVFYSPSWLGKNRKGHCSLYIYIYIYTCIHIQCNNLKNSGGKVCIFYTYFEIFPFNFVKISQKYWAMIIYCSTLATLYI